MLVRSCFLITVIKCLKGHWSLGSLFNVKIKRSVTQWVSEWVTRSPIELSWTAKNTKKRFLKFIPIRLADFFVYEVLLMSHITLQNPANGRFWGRTSPSHAVLFKTAGNWRNLGNQKPFRPFFVTECGPLAPPLSLMESNLKNILLNHIVLLMSVNSGQLTWQVLEC